MQFGDKIMKNNMKKLMCLMLATIFLISTNVFASKTTNNLVQNDNEVSKVNEYLFENYNVQTTSSEQGDIDPLVDLAVTVTIKEIRAFDKINPVNNPNFYVKVLINGVEHTSPIRYNEKYVKSNWSITQDVPDDKEFVNITIQLWSKSLGGSILCDISPNEVDNNYMDDYTVDLMYSLKSAHWTGDDYIGDPSGYGRLNGCDDNSIYQNDKDCEIWFDITQNDCDGDGIPYWTETDVFGTDPTIDNRGLDSDSDGVPIEWEFKWGHYFSFDWHHNEVENIWIYDPFVWEDHKNTDLDGDGLDNVEEYLVSQWGSDPFRKDVFLEIDQMEKGPNGEGAFMPELSKDLWIDASSRQNIVLHIDVGSMGGGEIIPFDNSTTDQELQNIYFNYFLHGDPNNWRIGAFHYGLIIYHSSRYPGFVFGTTADGEHYLLNSFQISTKYHESISAMDPSLYDLIKFKNAVNKRAVLYASAMMHETGHIFRLFAGDPPGCDDLSTVFPNKNWWKYHNYISCMNYNYVYVLVDYSDGSHGKNDFDDWNNLDLISFQDMSLWH
jgi:hypothetical protein